MLDGRHVELPTRELSGGARVRHVFNEMYARAMREQVPSRGITDEEVSTVIKNGAGVTGNLLVPQVRASSGGGCVALLACWKGGFGMPR